VPNVADYIEGVINLRGRIVPVIDLRKRLGEREIHASKKNRILVVELENKFVGLIVNSASEVLKIPPSEVEAPPTVAAESEHNYVTGVGKLNGRLIILLDVANLLRQSELRHLGEFAAPTANPV
jgi:purine-binding chemotaxis protein CheW